jgi:rhodanese-related sulfurtransferase
MNLRRTVLEASTLIIAALLCAVVANAFASRERRMALVGTYPNALKVPGATAEPASMTTSNMVRFDTQGNSATSVPVSTTQTFPPDATLVPVTMTATGTVTSSQTAVKPAVSPTAKPATPQVTSSAGRPLAAVSTAAPAPAPSHAEANSKFLPHEKTPYVELGGNDVAELFRQGVLFLDARRTSIYQQGHIAAAKSFPVWEADVDENIAKLFNERSDPRQQAEPIVVYCSGGDCEDSHMLSQKLWGAQFNNVYVYKDGFPDWEKRGGAVHRGDAP